MPDLTVNLGGFEIPMRNVFELVEITQPQENTNVTLDGTRWTDFNQPGNLRSWRLKFAYLCAEDFDTLYNLYLDQYSSATTQSLTVPLYGINEVAVKMSISDKNIKMDGDHIVDYEIILEEVYAIS